MFLALDPVTTDTRDHELIEAAETVLAMYRRGIITYASMGTGLTIPRHVRKASCRRGHQTTWRRITGGQQMSGLDFDPVGRIIRLPDKQQAEWLRDEYERGKRDGAAEERRHYHLSGQVDRERVRHLDFKRDH